MNDIASLTGQPTVLRLGDAEYSVYPLTVADFGKLQAWVDRQFPDPFDVIDRRISLGKLVVNADGAEARVPYAMGEKQHLYKLANDQAVAGRRLIGTPEADELLRSVPGLVEQLYLSISKGDPSVTRETCQEIVDNITAVQARRVETATTADMVMSGEAPKGGPGTPTGGTTPTPTTPGSPTTLSSVSAGLAPSPRSTGGGSSTRPRTPTSGPRSRSAG